jgi:nitrogen regulatory protein PII 2
MKEVMAVIRMNKMNQTKIALAEAGVVSFTARRVVGRGTGKVDYLLLKGAEAGCEEAIVQLAPGPKLIPKRLLNLVVPDDLVRSVVRTIIDVNQTGHPGDGKIFVMPISDSVRVRTGETGDAALDETLP